MAGLGFTASIPSTGGLTMVTNTAIKTLIQLLAATNVRFVVDEWSLSFNGTSNTTAPFLTEVLRQTSAGTGLNAITLAKKNPSDQETLQTSGQYGILAAVNTVEPTDAGQAAIMHSEFIHPQQGYAWRARAGLELVGQGATRMGIRTTAGTSYNAAGYLSCTE